MEYLDGLKLAKAKLQMRYFALTIFGILCPTFCIVAKGQNDTIKIYNTNGAIIIHNEAPDSTKLPLSFMVDNNTHILIFYETSKTVPYLDEASANYFKLPLKGPMGWGSGKIGYGNIVLQFNNLKIQESTFWVTPSSKLESLKQIDGIIGANVFNDKCILIDFEENNMTSLALSSTWNPLSHGFIKIPAKFTKKNKNTSITISVSILGKNQILLLDLGCKSAVLLNQKTYTKIANETSIDTIVEFGTVSGIKKRAVSIMDSAQIEIVGIPSKQSSVVGLSNKTPADGLLGIEYLRQFAAIILDYRSKAVYFKEKEVR